MTAQEKDELFSMLGYFACLGERLYMNERRLVAAGYQNTHVELYWYESIMALLRARFSLRELKKQ